MRFVQILFRPLMTVGVLASVIACDVSPVTDPMAPGAAPQFASVGNAHWILDETYCNTATLSCTFKAAGLGKNEGITVFVNANVTVTYDCDNPAAGIHIPKAFQNVQATGIAQQTYYSEKNGQITGTITLSPAASIAPRCPPAQQSGSDLVGGWQAVNVVVEAASGITISAPPRLSTLTF